MFTFNTEIRKYNLQSKVKKVNFLQSHNSLEPSKDLEVLCWCYIVYHASMRKKFDYHFLFTFSVHLFKLLETFPSILIPDWLRSRSVELQYFYCIRCSQVQRWWGWSHVVYSGAVYRAVHGYSLYSLYSQYRLTWCSLLLPLIRQWPKFNICCLNILVCMSSGQSCLQCETLDPGLVLPVTSQLFTLPWRRWQWLTLSVETEEQDLELLIRVTVAGTREQSPPTDIKRIVQDLSKTGTRLCCAGWNIFSC